MWFENDFIIQSCNRLDCKTQNFEDDGSQYCQILW
jgi:hypothetical protein